MQPVKCLKECLPGREVTMTRKVVFQGKAGKPCLSVVLMCPSLRFLHIQGFQLHRLGSKGCIHTLLFKKKKKKKKKFAEGILHTWKQELPEGIVFLGEKSPCHSELPLRASWPGSLLGSANYSLTCAPQGSVGKMFATQA